MLNSLHYTNHGHFHMILVMLSMLHFQRKGKSSCGSMKSMRCHGQGKGYDAKRYKKKKKEAVIQPNDADGAAEEALKLNHFQKKIAGLFGNGFVEVVDSQTLRCKLCVQPPKDQLQYHLPGNYSKFENHMQRSHKKEYATTNACQKKKKADVSTSTREKGHKKGDEHESKEQVKALKQTKLFSVQQMESSERAPPTSGNNEMPSTSQIAPGSTTNAEEAAPPPQPRMSADTPDPSQLWMNINDVEGIDTVLQHKCYGDGRCMPRALNGYICSRGHSKEFSTQFNVTLHKDHTTKCTSEIYANLVDLRCKWMDKWKTYMEHSGSTGVPIDVVENSKKWKGPTTWMGPDPLSVVADAVGCCWMLLDVVGCCWVLLGVNGCCWMLLDVVGCHWVLLDAV